jgi:uncharacterized membrane protein
LSAAKKRINLIVEDEVFKALTDLAKKRATSVANVCHDLLLAALDQSSKPTTTAAKESPATKK